MQIEICTGKQVINPSNGLITEAILKNKVTNEETIHGSRVLKKIL